MREFLLYPVLGPARDELVSFAIYLPALAVVNFPGQPRADLVSRLAENVRLLEPALDPKVLDLFQMAESSYRDLARVFDDAGSLANLKGQLWMEGPLEGEFQILGSIRGGAKKLSGRERDLVESLVFLKLAQEYDRAQIEVDRDLAGLTSLEEMLKDSLGPDVDARVADLSPPSTDEDLLVRPRFRAYLRLLRMVKGAQEAASFVSAKDLFHQAVISAAGEDLLEEEPASVVIATVPDPSGLADPNLELFLDNAENTGVLSRFRDALAGVVEGMAAAGEPDQEKLDLAAAISGEISTLAPLASQRGELMLLAAVFPFQDPLALLMHLFLGEKPPERRGRSVFLSLGPVPVQKIEPFGPAA